MTDQYAVIGNPITHSLSPMIHTLFARETEQDLIYDKIEVPVEQFRNSVVEFCANGGKGLNITMPFKQEAFRLVTTASDEAIFAEAVNTLSFLDGDIIGHNTDGIGLLRDLVNNQRLTIKNSSILILGAGGAVRGILSCLLRQEPKLIVIANRTLETAQVVAHHFQHLGNITATPLSKATGQFNLIINGANISLATATMSFPVAVLSPECFCYDLMYGQETTPFLKWAHHHGALHMADGLGMLVEQAAESFYIWRGVRPNTRQVISLLKKEMM